MYEIYKLLSHSSYTTITQNCNCQKLYPLKPKRLPLETLFGDPLQDELLI